MERLSRRGDGFHPGLSERHVLHNSRDKSPRDNSNRTIDFAMEINDGAARLDIDVDDLA